MNAHTKTTLKHYLQFCFILENVQKCLTLHFTRTDTHSPGFPNVYGMTIHWTFVCMCVCVRACMTLTTCLHELKTYHWMTSHYNKSTVPTLHIYLSVCVHNFWSSTILVVQKVYINIVSWVNMFWCDVICPVLLLNKATTLVWYCQLCIGSLQTGCCLVISCWHNEIWKVAVQTKKAQNAQEQESWSFHYTCVFWTRNQAYLWELSSISLSSLFLGCPHTSWPKLWLNTWGSYIVLFATFLHLQYLCACTHVCTYAHTAHFKLFYTLV